MSAVGTRQQCWFQCEEHTATDTPRWVYVNHPSPRHRGNAHRSASLIGLIVGIETIIIIIDGPIPIEFKSIRIDVVVIGGGGTH